MFPSIKYFNLLAVCFAASLNSSCGEQLNGAKLRHDAPTPAPLKIGETILGKQEEIKKVKKSSCHFCNTGVETSCKIFEDHRTSKAERKRKPFLERCQTETRFCMKYTTLTDKTIKRHCKTREEQTKYNDTVGCFKDRSQTICQCKGLFCNGTNKNEPGVVIMIAISVLINYFC